MSERLLHKVDRGSAIKRMGGMGVPQEMRTDELLEARPMGGIAHDPPNLRGREMPTLSATVDGGVFRLDSFQGNQLPPYSGREQDAPGLSPFPIYGDLPALGPSLQVLPFKISKLGHADS
jgi:hypothetical protein